jgi:hypothetical protein
VYLAAAAKGVFRLEVEGEASAPEVVAYPGRGGGNQVWLAAHLGITDDLLTVAGPAYELLWRKRAAPPLVNFSRDVAHEQIIDMDAYEDRYLVLGTQRVGQEMAPAVGWLGELKPGLPVLKTVLYSIAGKGAASIDRCASAELGHVRFLPDGGFAILPGGEPGLRLFDAQGKLVHIWDQAAVGADIQCDLDLDTGIRYSANPEELWKWVNRHTIVDDLLALPDDRLGLILRQVGAEGTTWTLRILGVDRPTVNLPIPVRSSSRLSRLRSDFNFQAGRLAFLRFEEGRRPAESSEGRLLVIVDLVTRTAP